MEQVVTEHRPAPKGLTLDEAQRLVASVLTAGRDRSFPPLTVAVIGQSGGVLALARADGASPLTAEIAVAKARTALVARMPSRDTEGMPEGIVQAARHLFGGAFVTRAGGLLVELRGVVVGAVGVSGASSDEDEEAALGGLERWQST